MSLIEQLAEIEHQQWITWARNLLVNEPGISQERRERWLKFFVPYEQLSESDKDKDREWARKVLRKIVQYNEGQ